MLLGLSVMVILTAAPIVNAQPNLLTPNPCITGPWQPGCPTPPLPPPPPNSWCQTNPYAPQCIVYECIYQPWLPQCVYFDPCITGPWQPGCPTQPPSSQCELFPWLPQCTVYECIYQPWLPQCLLIKNEISTEPTLGLCESNPWLPLCIVYDCYNQPCSLTNNEVSKQLVDKYNPLLRSQALESGNEHEKIVNYIITLANESNSNLTRMTEVSLNTLTEMGGITPEEREQLMPIISEATTNDTEITTGDIQALQNNASELLKELYENYASLEAISIASVLNNSIT